MVCCASDSHAGSLLASYNKRGPIVAGQFLKLGLSNTIGHINHFSRDGLDWWVRLQTCVVRQLVTRGCTGSIVHS